MEIKTANLLSLEGFLTAVPRLEIKDLDITDIPPAQLEKLASIVTEEVIIIIIIEVFIISVIKIYTIHCSLVAVLSLRWPSGRV